MAPWAPSARPLAWHLLAWALLALGLLWVGSARAQSLESVLSPGKMIAGHAKWEDDCKSCHIWFERGAQDRLCMDCHKDVGQDVRAKSGFHGRLKPPSQTPGQVCRTCHTEHKGADARIAEFDHRAFDHTLTDFQLRGKHAKASCESCHLPGKKFRVAAPDCNGCHKKDDTHKGALGPKCADCHTENSWKEAKFDHGTTRFALTGKHIDTGCASCHKDGAYKETPRACYACHKKNDDGPKGHKGLYGEKCESCHGTKAWKPSTFNHESDTRFALRGKHRTTGCADCHTGPVYKVKLARDHTATYPSGIVHETPG